MTGWTLAAAELRIPWNSAFAAHRMIVLADGRGEAVRQLNGLASWLDRGADKWRHKPIGYLPSDRLRGYDTAGHTQTWMPMHGVWPGKNISAAVERGVVRVLASDMSETDAAARLAPALDVLAAVNALSQGPEGGAGLPYPFLGFGPNSNSFFSTLLAAMDLVEPDFPKPAALVPGARGLLLSRPTIETIRQRHFLGTSGARNSDIAAAIASTPSAVG